MGVSLVMLLSLLYGYQYTQDGKSDAKHEWSYTGALGVSRWHKWYPVCGGLRQSPINIEKPNVVEDPFLNDFKFFGCKDPSLITNLTLTNNGHTAQVAVDGHCYVEGGNLPGRYHTTEFHFHWGSTDHKGSEHTVDGHRFPMELHLIQKSSRYNNLSHAMQEPDGLAVFAVFFELSAQDNPDLLPITNALPAVINYKDQTIVGPVSLEKLLPRDSSSYYRYLGSLTTPPCYESVIWTVFTKPLKISRRQLSRFRNLIEKDHTKAFLSAKGVVDSKFKRSISFIQDNFRNTQRINGRTVFMSKGAAVQRNVKNMKTNPVGKGIDQISPDSKFLPTSQVKMNFTKPNFDSQQNTAKVIIHSVPAGKTDLEKAARSSVQTVLNTRKTPTAINDSFTNGGISQSLNIGNKLDKGQNGKGEISLIQVSSLLHNQNQQTGHNINDGLSSLSQTPLGGLGLTRSTMRQSDLTERKPHKKINDINLVINSNASIPHQREDMTKTEMGLSSQVKTKSIKTLSGIKHLLTKTDANKTLRDNFQTNKAISSNTNIADSNCTRQKETASDFRSIPSHFTFPLKSPARSSDQSASVRNGSTAAKRTSHGSSMAVGDLKPASFGRNINRSGTFSGFNQSHKAFANLETISQNYKPSSVPVANEAVFRRTKTMSPQGGKTSKQNLAKTFSISKSINIDSSLRNETSFIIRVNSSAGVRSKIPQVKETLSISNKNSPILKKNHTSHKEKRFRISKAKNSNRIQIEMSTPQVYKTSAFGSNGVFLKNIKSKQSRKLGVSMNSSASQIDLNRLTAMVTKNLKSATSSPANSAIVKKPRTNGETRKNRDIQDHERNLPHFQNRDGQTSFILNDIKKPVLQTGSRSKTSKISEMFHIKPLSHRTNVLAPSIKRKSLLKQYQTESLDPRQLAIILVRQALASRFLSNSNERLLIHFKANCSSKTIPRTSKQSHSNSQLMHAKNIGFQPTLPRSELVALQPRSQFPSLLASNTNYIKPRWTNRLINKIALNKGRINGHMNTLTLNSMNTTLNSNVFKTYDPNSPLINSKTNKNFENGRFSVFSARPKINSHADYRHSYPNVHSKRGSITGRNSGRTMAFNPLDVHDWPTILNKVNDDNLRMQLQSMIQYKRHPAGRIPLTDFRKIFSKIEGIRFPLSQMPGSKTNEDLISLRRSLPVMKHSPAWYDLQRETADNMNHLPRTQRLAMPH